MSAIMLIVQTPYLCQNLFTNNLFLVMVKSNNPLLSLLTKQSQASIWQNVICVCPNHSWLEMEGIHKQCPLLSKHSHLALQCDRTGVYHNELAYLSEYQLFANTFTWCIRLGYTPTQSSLSQIYVISHGWKFPTSLVLFWSPLPWIMRISCK